MNLDVTYHCQNYIKQIRLIIMFFLLKCPENQFIKNWKKTHQIQVLIQQYFFLKRKWYLTYRFLNSFVTLLLNIWRFGYERNLHDIEDVWFWSPFYKPQRSQMISFWRWFIVDDHFNSSTNECRYNFTLLKHFKTLRHVSILSDHHQGALFFAKVLLRYSQFNYYLQTRCCGSISCCVGMCCGANNNWIVNTVIKL